ncbi:MAG TPA: GNAT family N-acetyltransferase [Candidatus Eremiobacteraceae bacterium]|nr:GNAT family N-acetyltransferase [Candidatus Eremiobacteraceae bacterium]
MKRDGAMAVNPPLQTARLDLEPLVRGHARAYFDGMRDPAMYTYYAGEPLLSIEAAGERIARWESRRSPDGSALWLNWMARIRGGAYIGWFQATVTGTQALIGYDVFVPHQRRGFGREGTAAMFEYLTGALRVERIDATVDTENIASIKLLESVGFSKVEERASDDLPGRRDFLYRVSVGP